MLIYRYELRIEKEKKKTQWYMLIYRYELGIEKEKKDYSLNYCCIKRAINNSIIGSYHIA